MADPNFIYFLRATGGEGPIKIGSSIRPETRCEEFNRGSPLQLEIIATFRGERKFEGMIHNYLRDSHDRLEWFKPTPKVLALIGAVNSGDFDPASLPRKSWKPGKPPQPWVTEEQKRTSTEFLSKLGSSKEIAEALGIAHSRVANWMHPTRSIPWRFRHALARMAREKNVPLPEDFLGEGD